MAAIPNAIDQVAQVASLIIAAQNAERQVKAQERGQNITAGVMTRGQDLTYGSNMASLMERQRQFDNPPPPPPTAAMSDVQYGQKNVPGWTPEMSQQRLGGVMPPQASMQRFDSEEESIRSMAQGILEGTVPPDASGLRGKKPRLIAALRELDPTFDFAAQEKDYQATKQFLRTKNSMRYAMMRDNANRVLDTIPLVEKTYRDWRAVATPVEIRRIKSIELGTSRELELKDLGPAAQSLVTMVNDFVFELQQVYGAGYAPTDKSLELAAENLKANWGDETFTRVLNLLRKNVEIRVNSLNTFNPMTFTGGLGGGTRPAGLTVTPPAAGTPPSSPAATPPPAPAGGGPPPGAQSGDVYLDANGNLQTVP